MVSLGEHKVYIGEFKQEGEQTTDVDGDRMQSGQRQLPQQLILSCHMAGDEWVSWREREREREGKVESRLRVSACTVVECVAGVGPLGRCLCCCCCCRS